MGAQNARARQSVDTVWWITGDSGKLAQKRRLRKMLFANNNGVRWGRKECEQSNENDT